VRWILLILSACGAAYAAPLAPSLGQTFPIAEPDTLQEIRAAAQRRDWKAWMRRTPREYSAFDSARLPVAKKDAVRMFDPTYTVPADLRNEKGEVLIARGTRVNVYERIKVPGRYVVIAATAAHYRWLEEVVKPTDRDKVLVANGNVLEARQRTNRAVYQLDARFIERFGVRAVPSVIEQAGTMLKVTEYGVR
jgi:conjugal transfer pilus assembly protein TraW